MTSSALTLVDTFQPSLWARTIHGELLPLFSLLSREDGDAQLRCVLVNPRLSDNVVEQTLYAYPEPDPQAPESHRFVWRYRDAAPLADSDEGHPFAQMHQLQENNYLVAVLEPHQEAWSREFLHVYASSLEVLRALRAASNLQIVARTYLECIKRLDATFAPQVGAKQPQSSFKDSLYELL